MDLHEAFNLSRVHQRTRTRNIIAAVLTIIGIVVLWVTGFGFLATVGLALIVVLIILFGSLGKLVSSFVIASLLNMFLPTIKEFVFVFFSGARTQQLFSLIESTGWVKLTMVIFLFTYALSYFTGCFQFLKIDASTTVENKSGS